ncbi:MAG: S46 family peptidase [Candidatus Aminicenantes bacterium]|nr:S46 family peptidase [Candidatus Aminicenantes bacterium]
MTFIRRSAFFMLILAAALAVSADEGMWLPHQIKGLALESQGLRMNPDDLYKKDGTGLMSAIVNLGGGTGEFVSPDGLILTNHHVAFGAIQRASSKEKDYIQDGFYAPARADEISAPGYIADVLLGYEDVTAQVQAKLRSGLTPRQRYDAIEKAEKELIARAEKGGPDLRATIAAMYSGNQYFLFTFKRIKDVRLVLAPPLDLGNCGGEVDNWMWPRHTADFSFLRAYVSKTGVGADFSPENVPYKPKSYVRLSLDGFREGDFTFIMGYPGRTYRNNTAAEIRSDAEAMKSRMGYFKDIIAFFEEAGKSDKEVEIRYASLVKGLYNGLKNYQGKLEGFDKIGLLDKKDAQDKAFLEWVNADPVRKAKYGSVLPAIEEFAKRLAAENKRNEALTNLVSAYGGSQILSVAYTIVRTADESLKPDIQREPAYQKRNLPLIRQRLELAERGYDLATDRAYLKHRMKALRLLPADQLPKALQTLFAGKSDADIDAFVDRLYDNTGLADPKKRLMMVGLTPAALAKLKDPAVEFAAGLEKELKVLREERKAKGQEAVDLKKAYEAARLEQRGGKVAPDANGTLRLTFGPVEGYKPKDGVFYLPQTTLAGVLEKETGTSPFIVPAKLKDLHRARDFGRYADPVLKDVPACFLNTTNVTGGNSGSPTFNAKGEQIGIIFDMTYESVVGDYYVIPEYQRSISVDVRYVLFVTEKFCGAAPLIKELGL